MRISSNFVYAQKQSGCVSAHGQKQSGLVGVHVQKQYGRLCADAVWLS